MSTAPCSTHPLDTLAAARDCWPGGTLEMWNGTGSAPVPDKVFWPRTEAEVLEVLQAAVAAGVPIVPYGMGSGVCGGARGREGSWVIDTKLLRGIGPLDEEAWTIRVEAGVNGQELEDHLQAGGFTLGHSPSSISCSSVGGWAAARSAGQFSSRYGVFEDMVLGLTVVTPAEGVLELGVHGDDDPEFMPLILGSEGTLGIITSVTVRIWRRPESRWLRGYRFRTVEDALATVRELMQGELWPSVVRIYDPVDTRIGGKTRPKRAKDGNGSYFTGLLKAVGELDPIRKRSLALPLALPGLVNQIFDALASGCLLIVGWEGEPEVVEASVAAGRVVLEAKGEDLGSEPGHRWYDSRHAVSYKLMPVFERGGFADTMEVAARWSALPGLYHAVREAVRPHAVVLAHMSHVYPEGGSIYFSFAGRGDEGVYREVWRAAQGVVLANGGTVSHHHGIGSLKAKWASQEVGAAVEGWTRAKDRLDPARILNPDRLFQPVVPADPGPDPELAPEDGLLRCPLHASLAERTALAERLGVELMYPYETLPVPPRWLRDHWQLGWSEVSGRVEARRARVGRGPRSAVGPDLRGWLAEQEEVRCTVPVVPLGERWMAWGTPRHPAKVARALLRGDLRPAVLHVHEGRLTVGFRGPAAAAFGALARRWVPGGLTEIPYEAQPLPGELVACALDEAEVIGSHHAGRRQ